jgi:hypothetical protein
MAKTIGKRVTLPPTIGVMRRTLALALGALLCVASQASATLIMVVIERDRIVIGADSLRQVGDGPPEQVCKIRSIGDGHYAGAAGLVGSKGNAGFDLWSIISKAGQDGGSLQAKAARVEALVIKPFQAALRGDPQALERRIDVALVGFENGSPAGVFRRLVPRRAARGGFAIEAIDACAKPKCTAAPGSVTAIGNGSEVLQGFDPRASLSAAGVVRNAMELATARLPKSVGPPINILELDASGGRWIQVAASCR